LIQYSLRRLGFLKKSQISERRLHARRETPIEDHAKNMPNYEACDSACLWGRCAQKRSALVALKILVVTTASVRWLENPRMHGRADFGADVIYRFPGALQLTLCFYLFHLFHNRSDDHILVLRYSDSSWSEEARAVFADCLSEGRELTGNATQNISK